MIEVLDHVVTDHILSSSVASGDFIISDTAIGWCDDFECPALVTRWRFENKPTRWEVATTPMSVTSPKWSWIDTYDDLHVVGPVSLEDRETE